jgi:hypothetical protein
MTPHERRREWAKTIKTTRYIAMDWKAMASLYPYDKTWAAKCASEHARIMDIARQYLKTSKDFVK